MSWRDSVSFISRGSIKILLPPVRVTDPENCTVLSSCIARISCLINRLRIYSGYFCLVFVFGRDTIGAVYIGEEALLAQSHIHYM